MKIRENSVEYDDINNAFCMLDDPKGILSEACWRNITVVNTIPDSNLFYNSPSKEEQNAGGNTVKFYIVSSSVINRAIAVFKDLQLIQKYFNKGIQNDIKNHISHLQSLLKNDQAKKSRKKALRKR